MHREAFIGCMYESQARSKNDISISKKLKSCFALGDLYKELNSKYFKRTYNGKPTKRFLNIVSRIQEANKLQEIDVRKLFEFQK